MNFENNIGYLKNLSGELICEMGIPTQMTYQNGELLHTGDVVTIYDNLGHGNVSTGFVIKHMGDEYVQWFRYEYEGEEFPKFKNGKYKDLNLVKILSYEEVKNNFRIGSIRAVKKAPYTLLNKNNEPILNITSMKIPEDSTVFVTYDRSKIKNEHLLSFITYMKKYIPNNIICIPNEEVEVEIK